MTCTTEPVAAVEQRHTSRLLPRSPAAHLADHLRRLGPLPRRGRALIGEVERAGLRGRGGAGFPTGIKLESVRAHGARLGSRAPVVVANGTEGEPLSEKDKTLLVHAPHLVLDGVVAAAHATGAPNAIVCVERTATTVLHAVGRAVSERAGLGDGVDIRIAATPARYVVGEETALVAWLNGGEAKPAFTPPRPFERGVERRPTLVDNVETLAHVGLIARFGARWWREAGTADDPGTMLVTVHGVDRPGVYEVELGTPLKQVLRSAGAHDVLGVLVGGYFGAWLTPRQAAMATLARDDLEQFGAAPGCGAIAVLGRDQCPLAEIARVARWFAAQSAGQCGPCVLGLPAIAAALDDLTRADRRARVGENTVAHYLELVAGRGACKLPDGAVRFVSSGLRAFADHVAEHAAGRACPAITAHPALPVPRPEASWR